MADSIQRAQSYLVHQQLAAGGMGEVYLGTTVSQAGRRPVAIKRLSADRLRDGRSMTRLVAEARLGYQLTHANICQVLDLVFDTGHAYIVMEYVRGADLRALIASRAQAGGHLDTASALYVAREVARALDYAHRFAGADGDPLHIVHGDVTPQNILLSLEGEVKLADFGIARALGTSAPGTDVVGGTRGFVAPEVVAGDPDHRSDVYSLGATLHAALTGLPPASPASAAGVRERADVAPEIAAVVERAIARDPAHRFLSAAELEAALAYELARRYPGYTPSSLATLVRGAARPDSDADDDRSLFTIATQASTMLLGDDTDVVPPWPTTGATRDAAPAPGPRMTKTITGGARPVPPSRRRVAWVLGFGAVAAAGASVTAWRLLDRDAAPALPRSTPPTPRATANDADAGALAGDPSSDGAREPRERRRKSAAAKRRRAKRDADRTPEPAYLSVNATPWGAVFVDGKRIADETPVYRWELPPGKYRVRVVFGDTGEARTKRVTLAPGTHESVGFFR